MQLLDGRLHTARPDRHEMAWEANAKILHRVRQDPQASCVQRVLNLLNLIREVEELRLEPRKGYSGDIHALSLALKERLKTVERLGKRYRWSPALTGDYSLGLTSTFTWSERTRDSKWENEAVSWLMKHANTSGRSPSRILRFRICQKCPTWFYALTDHQHYCTAKCRQKFHSASAEFRAKRATYMRERYRPAEKERDKHSELLARRKL